MSSTRRRHARKPPATNRRSARRRKPNRRTSARHGGEPPYPGPPENLLTVREAADMLQVSRSTIRRLTRTGRIPAVKVGRLVRYDRVALRNALEPFQ